jgi:VWFA-related protein
MMMRTRKTRRFLFAVIVILCTAAHPAAGQGQPDGSNKSKGSAKPITVPVTVRERRPNPEKEMRFVNFLIREDGEMQTQLSVRSRAESPMWLAILIQDDLVSSIATETKGLAKFVSQLPAGSRVMVGNIRTGSLEVRRKFTPDLDRAAKSLRPPMGLASASPFNPYVEIIEALHRFDSQPLGRRAIIVVSDGLDVSRGADSSGPTQSLDLQRAINEAQRRSVAIYSIFAPSVASAAALLNLNGQSCLQRLSNETGGRAFFQGTGAPVSFDPFLREIDEALNGQIALTYLSTHAGKGFHRLDIKPVEGDFELRHPAGYTR